jgi:hypothetical protein
MELTSSSKIAINKQSFSTSADKVVLVWVRKIAMRLDFITPMFYAVNQNRLEIVRKYSTKGNFDSK